jgi:tRNA pseudouridine55 synthase
MVSALKRGGTPLYVLARRGEVVERAPRKVTIRRLNVLSVELPAVEFEVSCSRGTYVRTLAHDIGESLGTGAHLEALVRTGVGPFDLNDAISLADFEGCEGVDREAGLSMFDALSFMPEVRVTEGEVDRISTGGSIALSADRTRGLGGGLVRVSADGRALAAVGRLSLAGQQERGEADTSSGPEHAASLRPVRVFVEPY